jgi:peptidoglycan/xylan/chitin deacetylase (PgdA/CDA1 family)
VQNLLHDKKISRLFELSRQRKIEIFCNKAIDQLKSKSLKTFSKQWMLTVVLIIRYRFLSIIKSLLKKVKNKLNSILNNKKNIAVSEFRIYVLMYHKIDNTFLDPWNLNVTKENFESHLQLFNQTNTVINTNDLVEYLRGSKILNKDQIYITFDDGYEDNALIAAPLLEQYQIPATLFITNHSLVDQPVFFWWDILEIIFLHQLIIPSVLNIIINEQNVIFNFDKEANLEYIDIETLIWKGKETYNKRTEAYFKIWKLLIGLTPTEQYNIIEQLKTWSEVDLSIYNNYKVMNQTMLINLKKNEFIEIGGHTKSHVSLSQVEKTLQEEEIIYNKMELEKLLQKELRVFAYPYGRTSLDASKIISESKYAAAFTCVPHPITSELDKTMLGRFQVNNYGKNDLIELLSKTLFHY